VNITEPNLEVLWSGLSEVDFRIRIISVKSRAELNPALDEIIGNVK